jgi:hypothetical protein
MRNLRNSFGNRHGFGIASAPGGASLLVPAAVVSYQGLGSPRSHVRNEFVSLALDLIREARLMPGWSQTQKSGRAIGKSALPSRTDIVSLACHVRKVPVPEIEVGCRTANDASSQAASLPPSGRRVSNPAVNQPQVWRCDRRSKRGFGRARQARDRADDSCRPAGPERSVLLCVRCTTKMLIVNPGSKAIISIAAN